MALRFAVRVKPGSARTAVGGRWRGGALIVAVPAPAVEGKANAAVCRALADAFGVRRNQVTIVRGERGRDKLVEIDPPPLDGAATLASMLDGH
jgi:uncharacterized protein